MRRGFTDFSANNLADLIPNPNAPPAVAESLINRRRVVVMWALTFLVIPNEVESLP